MSSAIPLVIALMVGAGANSEYTRTLSLLALDQAAFDAETYGEKAALNREADGLRMTLAPAKAETGWKTPQQIRFGGDFTITATVAIKTLPKPVQEDGAAVGMAIAFQDINQPDATLLRMREPKGPDVYRFIEKSQMNPQQQMQSRCRCRCKWGCNQELRSEASRPNCRARRFLPRAKRFGCRFSARVRSFAFRLWMW